MDFNEALIKGKEFEVAILGLIKIKNPNSYIIPGKFEPFDIYIADMHKRVEVKKDVQCMDTGNLLVEVGAFDKYKGLLATESDWMIFYSGEELIWIKPVEIMKLILYAGIEQRRFVGKGDDYEKRAYLVPKELMIEKADFITDWKYNKE